MVKEIPINTEQWDHPALTFDEALGIAEKIKKMGGIATSDQLAKALGIKQGGWYAVQLASVKRWSLLEGRGDLKITDYFRRITSPRSQGDDVRARVEVFLNVPLFKSLYDKYHEDGLPQDPFFTNVLRDDYGLKGRNPSLAATIIRDFVDKYMPGFKIDGVLIKSSTDSLKDAQSHSLAPKHETGTPSHQNTLFTVPDGDFPIRIITKNTKPLDWDIHHEEDWEVVEKYINSLKKRWSQSKGQHHAHDSGKPGDGNSG